MPPTSGGGSSASTGTPPPTNRAAPATLEGAAINLSAIREQGRNELIDILEDCRGRKCLVLDTTIGGLLGHIIPEGVKLLKQHGVVYLNRGLRASLNFITPEGRPDDPDHVLYFVRPSIPQMKLIADQIRERRRRDGLDHRYRIYFVPHRLFICEQVLEDEGVLQYCDLLECQLDVFPMDNDILSLELDTAFKDCYVEGDTSSLTTVARSLLKLQGLYGAVPNIKAKGQASRIVLQRFLNMKKDQYDPSAPVHSPEIDTLLLIDREVDLVTPLLTPLTYEGLIDEFIGIQSGCVKVDPQLAGDEGGPLQSPGEPSRARGSPTTREPVAIALNANDRLYSEVRDLNIEVLGTQLQERAKEIKQQYAVFKTNRDAASITEIHDFVKSIPGLTQKYRSLNLHINIAELLKPTTTDNVRFRQKWQVERSMLEGESCYDYLEDMIAGYEPVTQVLRP